MQKLWDAIKKRVSQLRRHSEEIKPLLEAKEKADQFGKLFDQVLTTHTSNRLSSDNEDVNKLYALASALANHLAPFARHGPDYWLTHSGANLFNAADNTEALKRLVAVREDVDGMIDAAEGLSALTKTITAKDYADVKGAAKSLTTAAIADVEARKETWQRFELCVHHCESIRKNVVLAVETVRDMQNALHMFLVNRSNPRSFSDAQLKHSPFFKPGAIEALKINPWKRTTPSR